MIPRFLYRAMASGFTSGTTRGISGTMRKAFVLSITTQPAAAAMGANFSLMLPPAEKRPISIPRKEFSVKSSTGRAFPRKVSSFPIDLFDARSVSFPTGN